MTSSKNIFWYLGLVLIDQVSKYLIVTYSDLASINRQGAFDFKVGQLDHIYLSVAALALFVSLVYFLNRDYFYRAAVILILSGGLSNLIDRFARGGVVDFISTGIFPSFNLADAFITVGAVLLVVELVGYRGNSKL